MYQISLLEDGHLSTAVGGPIRTLTEMLDQLMRFSATVNGEELREYVGFRFDRGGKDCALVVTDRFGMFLRVADIVED